MESSWQLGRFESSEEDKGKDKKDDTPKRRHDPPRILNISQLHEGQIDLRPSRPESIPKVPLFEGLVQRKHETHETHDTKGDEGGSEHDAASRLPDLPPIAETVPLDAAEHHVQLHAPEVSTSEAEESDEDEDDGEDRAVAKHAAPIAWTAPAAPAAEQTRHPAEFDDVVRQFSSEFDEASAGDPAEAPTETPVEGESPVPFTAPEHEPALLDHDTEPPLAPHSLLPFSSGPPRPPIVPRVEHGSFDDEPEPDSGSGPVAAMHNAAPDWGRGSANSAPSAGFVAAEQQTQTAEATRDIERRSLRRGLVAGFITGYALKAFLAHRKLKRYQEATGRQMAAQSEQIADLQSQQTQLREQNATQAAQVEQYRREQEQSRVPNPSAMPGFEGVSMTPAAASAAANMAPSTPFRVPEARPAEAKTALPPVEALPPVQTAEAQVIVDENGNEIPLLPGQRLERRGWYSVVLDEHGREVPGAIHYGEAFQREQKREQLSASVLSGSDANGASAGMGGGSFTALPGVGVSSVPPTPMISSGQADPQRALSVGQPAPVDPQHRLPEPRNQIVAAATSPWLWLAVAVLLIAYFTAALI